MSRSKTTPPNTVGRPSSFAAIRELTAAVELTDWYLDARVDFREQSAMAITAAKKAPNPTDRHIGSRVRMRRKMLAMSQASLASFPERREYLLLASRGRVRPVPKGKPRHGLEHAAGSPGPYTDVSRGWGRRGNASGGSRVPLAALQAT
jgi:hypothetical protein